MNEVLVDTKEMKCIHRTTLTHLDGGREFYELTRRHYNLPEVRERLAAAHLELLQAYHAFDSARPYGSEEQGLVVIAQRTL